MSVLILYMYTCISYMYNAHVYMYIVHVYMYKYACTMYRYRYTRTCVVYMAHGSNMIYLYMYMYLPPIIEEVLTKHLLLGVVVIQHLSKETRGLFRLLRELERFAIVHKLNVAGKMLVKRCKVRPLKDGGETHAQHTMELIYISCLSSE